MSGVKAPLSLRIKSSLRGAKTALLHPAYLAVAALTSFLISSLIIWSLNLDLVKFILFDAPLSLFEKFRFFWDSLMSIYTTYSSPHATIIVVFSVLFGINIALMTYVIRHASLRNIPKKSGGGGLFLAILGGGCIACGTSILAPVLATIGATSSAFVNDLSLYLNLGGSVLVLYSIYSLGGVINNIPKN